MTSVPSSNNPKSNAPMEIKFAGSPCIFKQIIANRKANGITDATIKVVFQLFKKIKTIIETRRTPSIRFLETVCTVLFTSFVRSITGSILTFAGKIRWFSSSIFAFSLVTTAEGFSPLSIMTIPWTRSSSWLSPTCPSRGFAPSSISATCLTKIGVLPTTLTKILPISSILSNRPTPRTT
ncbi:hypothetical protein D3C81_786550 [compost metagenome]